MTDSETDCYGAIGWYLAAKIVQDSLDHCHLHQLLRRVG